MGISRDSEHKRRATGGRRVALRMKRKFQMGRQPSSTKIGPKRIRDVRGRGGNIKKRALRLDAGNFSWPSESVTRRVRILDIVYNASSNELVRTKTLVKSCIAQVDAAPYRLWYEATYGVELGKKRAAGDAAAASKSAHAKRRMQARAADRVIDPQVAEQFASGRLLVRLTSRPGQSGRADGYVLEGAELAFYLRKLHKKKGKQ
eukprot:TRINITY_DN1207_c1_g1_i1.p1 TRINITY_DN1207_c1_g1~~TRINITY_DN1207_c1_g1_i1.p1  ORF type:complete len:218 (+),score=122.53 TRINITY_DN1207_c1_g1_i1:44-655(+)